MAHINAAKRRRWLWTVISVGVLTVIAGFFWTIERASSDNESSPGVDTAAATDGATAIGPEANALLEDYVQFADAVETRGADVNQTLIVDGLRKLAGVLGTLNLGSLELQTDLRVAAEHILLNPASTATTESVRNGLIAAANAIETGRDDAGSLRRLAESIRPDVPLLDQQATVSKFFQASAKAIQNASLQTFGIGFYSVILAKRRREQVSHVEEVASQHGRMANTVTCLAPGIHPGIVMR